MPFDVRPANACFATWWAGLAANALLTALFALSLAAGVASAALAWTLLVLTALVISAALWGLLSYLAYVYTGRLVWIERLAHVWAAIAAGLVLLVVHLAPTGATPAALGYKLEFGREVTPTIALAFAALAGAPAMLGAVGYLGLYRRADTREARYRILIVACALGVWIGWTLLSVVLQMDVAAEGFWPLVVANRALGLIVPSLVVLAYRPPARFRRALHLGAEPRPLG